IRYTHIQRKSPTSFAVYLEDKAQETLFDDKVLGSLPLFKKVSSNPTEKGFQVIAGIEPETLVELKDDLVRKTMDTIRRRLVKSGVGQPSVVRKEEDRVVVRLPEPERGRSQVIELIKRPGLLEFRLVDDAGDLDAALQGKIPPETDLLYEVSVDPANGSLVRRPFLVKKRALLTGELLRDARARVDRIGHASVTITFSEKGAKLFEKITGDHAGKRLAIVFDGRVFSAPVIKEKVSGGKAIIQGVFTRDQAGRLALVLRAGPLPAPVRILETQTESGVSSK
ncbi:preprotein translocase subunit SecD, partial [Thermodesulfobacteriota bacterium]